MSWYIVRNPETGISKLMWMSDESPSIMRVRDWACRSIYFGWAEYKNLRVRKARKKDVEQLPSTARKAVCSSQQLPRFYDYKEAGD